jgi:hypothetical protein
VNPAPFLRHDKLADYGTWDLGSFGPELKTLDMLPREYAREAWKRGMAYEAKLGANLFRFGVIGSTDAHAGLATTGTRIRVRVFAGMAFGENDLARSDFVAYGYANGVPMGGDLGGSADKAPLALMIKAVRDPDAPLDDL